MPDGHNDRKRRNTLLRLPIGNLVAWHLVCACLPCRKEVIVPIGPLIDQFSPEVTLLQLVPKLRCSAATCRRQAAKVRLRNRYPAQMGGGPFHDVHLAPPFGY